MTDRLEQLRLRGEELCKAAEIEEQKNQRIRTILSVLLFVLVVFWWWRDWGWQALVGGSVLWLGVRIVLRVRLSLWQQREVARIDREYPSDGGTP